MHPKLSTKCEEISVLLNWLARGHGLPAKVGQVRLTKVSALFVVVTCRRDGGFVSKAAAEGAEVELGRERVRERDGEQRSGGRSKNECVSETDKNVNKH